MNEPKEWLAKPGGIAKRLEAIHEASGITGKELAERLGWAPSKVTRIRRGVTEPTPDDVVRWARETGAAGQVDELLAILGEVPAARYEFRERMAEGQAAVQQVHTDLLAESTLIRYFDTAWIPGLLQTREYARRVFEEFREINGPKDDIEQAVATRMQRQAYLYDPGKKFEVLIHEPALHQGTIGRDIMVPQLHVLLTWLNASNVQLAVLPLRGRNRRTPVIGFQMYDEFALAEDWASEIERPADLFARMFQDMWSGAAVGEDARPLIEKAIADWGHGG